MSIKQNTNSLKFTNEELIYALQMMILIRKFEEAAGLFYLEKKIAGFCHLCIGQEAIPTAIYYIYKMGDQVITSYRAHGFFLASGGDPKMCMAELLGKITGCSKGKGGSMHMFNTEKGFYGGHGIVGAQVPIGTGMAFSNKYQEKKNVSFVLFGDGAANQGQVYESFNMASMWKLPVVYLIENNGYAMGTSVSRGSCDVPLYKRGESFGIPGQEVDGMDFIKLSEELHKAREYALNNGPILLEIKTYRYKGHSMSDPGKYRTTDEVNNFKKNNDPIENLKKYLMNNKIINTEKITHLEKEIKNQIKEINQFAEDSVEPELNEMWSDIIVEKD